MLHFLVSLFLLTVNPLLNANRSRPLVTANDVASDQFLLLSHYSVQRRQICLRINSNGLNRVKVFRMKAKPVSRNEIYHIVQFVLRETVDLVDFRKKTMWFCALSHPSSSSLLVYRNITAFKPVCGIKIYQRQSESLSRYNGRVTYDTVRQEGFLAH